MYQYIAPVIALPLAYVLWLGSAQGDHRFAVWMVALPVAFAYIVPAVGTNVLRVWEFNTRFRLGRFRPHHGFVFGSATACIAWLAWPSYAEPSAAAGMRTGFILGSALAFWNWLYDAQAIRAGFLCVYTRSYADRQGADAIAMDYAPPIFGLFGLGYGATAVWMRPLLAEPGWSSAYWIALVTAVAFCIALSVGGYVAWSLIRFGESGLKSYQYEQRS